MAERAVTIAGVALEILPPSVDVNKPDEEKGSGELLVEGMRSALLAGRDICRAYDPEADIRERRLVSDTAAWVARLGVRVVEQEFRSRDQDKMGELLERIRLAQGSKG